MILCRMFKLTKNTFIIKTFALFIFLFGASVAMAASINFTSNTPLILTSPSVTVTALSGSVADGLVVNSGNIVVTMSSTTGGSFTVTSPVAMTVTGGSISQVCSTGIETETITQASGSATYTLTPTGSACGGTTSTTPSGGGGSSGGSGGHIAIPSSTINTTPVVTPPTTPSTSTTYYNFGTTTLKNGSKGDAVKELQRFLNDSLSLGLIVDGKLGPMTINVIKKWQKAHGLVPDGLIGPKTKALMNNSAPLNTPANTTHTGAYNFGFVTLQIHSRGEAVKELQIFLNAALNTNMTVDGVFGQNTLTAVQNWQRIHGLTPDGGVGPKTKAAMQASLKN